MTLQTLTGASMLWPGSVAMLNSIAGLSGMFTIDAATEAGAVCGPVNWPNRTDTSKDITHVHFNAGAIASFGGSSRYRVSLQDVSTTAGPPLQPDGTIDQSFVSAAGTGPTANAWNRVALSTSRTVTFGEMLAVVFDYDTFTAADSIIIRGLLGATTHMRGMVTGASLYTGTWADQAMHPVLLLEFSDGTFGTVGMAVPVLTFNSRSFNVDTTGSGGLAAGDERGLEFSPEVDIRCDGVLVDFNVAAGGNCDIVAYEGSTAMTGGTITVDANAVAVNGSVRRGVFWWAQELLFNAGTTYRIVVKPTTTTNVVLNTVTLNDAAHRVLFGGTGVYGNSRVDAGSWGTASSTELPLISLMVSAIDDGAGSGGSGMVINPGMSGGIRG